MSKKFFEPTLTDQIRVVVDIAFALVWCEPGPTNQPVMEIPTTQNESDRIT